MSNLNILGMSSITNSGTLEVMVADPNNPTLDIRTTLPVGGGGGGSYVGDTALGITIVGSGPGTIQNTGTIVLPSAAGSASGTGITLTPSAPGSSGTQAGSIYLYGPSFTSSATGLFGATVDVYTGDVTTTYPGGAANSGGAVITGGLATNGTATGSGAAFSAGGGNASGSDAGGGGFSFTAGYGHEGIGGTGTGGSLAFLAGPGGTKGGDISFASGTGAANGVILLNNQGTIGTDPHVLNADWVSSIAGVGFVVMRSQG